MMNRYIPLGPVITVESLKSAGPNLWIIKILQARRKISCIIICLQMQIGLSLIY